MAAMFPQRKGLGVQLAHGLPGPAIPLLQYDTDEPWVFARQRDGGIPLRPVQDSLIQIVPPQFDDDVIVTKLKRRDDPKIVGITREFIDEMQKNEYIIEKHPLIFDPSEGSLLDFHTCIQKRNKIVPVIAFVTNEYKNNLVVQELMEVTEKVTRTGSTETTDAKVKTYTLGTGVSLLFPHSIKQVHISKLLIGSSTHNKNSLAVLTSHSMTLVTFFNFNKYTIETGAEITCDEFGEQIVHVACNPYDISQFAIAGAKGRWAILKNTGKRLKVIHTGHVHNANELSTFKRISWTNDSDKIVFMGRTFLKKIDFETGKSTDIISATHWSQIRDYQMWLSDPKFAFLLTSKELIWCDTSDGIKRVLAWKHNMPSNDPSLKLSFHDSEDDTKIVMLSCLTTPIVLVYEFKLDDDGLPKSVRDPFMLETGTEGKTHDIVLIPSSTSDEEEDDNDDASDKCFTTFQLSQRLELTKCTLSNFEASLPKKELQQPVITNDMSSPDVSQSKTASAICEALFHGPMPHKERMVDDSLILQEYASKFHFDKSEDFQPTSLFNAAPPAENVYSLEEFDSMIEQLLEYCRGNGFDTVSMRSLSKILFKEEIESMSELYDKITKIWTDDRVAIREVVRDLCLSLSVVFDAQVEKNALIEEMDMMPTKTRKLVRDWDENYDESDDEFGLSGRSASESEAPMVEEPVIRLTQTQNSQPASQQSQIMRPSQRFGSQKMGSQRLGSQGASQKRKKRKVKGFA